MLKLAFTDELKTGHPRIDQQHEILIGLINSLAETHVQTPGEESVDRVLDELVRYVHVHFRTEEEYMAENGFTELAAHREKHQEFEYKVATWIQAHEEGQQEDLAEIMPFLSEWLVEHIMGSDREMVRAVMGAPD